MLVILLHNCVSYYLSVPPSTDPGAEEPQNLTEVGPPKVIYTTVKRKVNPQPPTKSPNFSFRPDVTEKDHGDNNKEDNDPKDPSTLPKLTAKPPSLPPTKQEKTSPLHNNYESSMSPLNLNTSAINKYTGHKGTTAGLTITPVSQADESITEFQDVADNYNAILHSRGLESNFTADYKESHEQMFAKSAQQLYANFGANAVSNLYTAATSAASSVAQFAASNPYGLHFAREENN